MSPTRHPVAPLTWAWRALAGGLLVFVGIGVALGWGTCGAHGAPTVAGQRAAGLMIILATALGALRTSRGDDLRDWPAAWLATVSLLGGLACVLAPVAETSVASILAMVVAAGAREGWRSVPYLTAPMIGHGFLAWWLSGPWVAALGSPALAGAVMIGAGALRARRERAELETARAVVRTRERARAEAVEAQTRLAEQVHDVLAHSLSGLVVSLQVAQAQAAAEGASPELQQRLAAARTLAADGLRGARDAVEALHGTEAGPGGEPSILELVERIRCATGTEVDVRGDADLLPADRLPLVRAVVREALTNSVRHAPGRRVTVSLAADSVDVLTHGDGRPEPSGHVSGQHGIEGLRRRVEASGGRFGAGRVPGGWRVTAYWAA